MASRPLVINRLSPTVAKAQLLAGEGREREARALLEQHLRRGTRDAAAWGLLAFQLASGGESERALLLARRSRDLDPDEPGILQLCGNTLCTLGHSDEARRAYSRALELDPENLGSIQGLAMLASVGQRFGEAAVLARRGLELAPGDGAFTTLLAGAWQAFGRGAEALALIERALDAAPDDEELLYARAVGMNAVDGVAPAAIGEAHRRFGRRRAEGAGSPLAPPGPRRPGPIRVGLVSGDFRAHSCANFIMPLIEHLDRGRFEAIAFSACGVSDGVTERMRQRFTSWHDVRALGDRAAAELVRSLDVDVLVDLQGLTIGERLGLFCLRPARVHATYLGYPNTTGLPAMDRRIVDAVTDPDGFEERCTESLSRTEGCFVCYSPVTGPWPEPRPRDDGAALTFGSFNALGKLTDRVVSLWSEIVNGVPGSSLLLKASALADETAAGDTRTRFERAGLAPERLTLMGWVREEPMLLYDRVDVALDPFPYNGVTTTCEALWMGVPVVALEGNTHAGRVGASLLRHAGLPELVASTCDEYARNAAELIRDRARLAGYRQSLRARVRRTIGDGAAFARRFEGVLGEMLAAPAERALRGS